MHLKVNFIYSDLNPCGGAERLALVTMQSVLEMGIDMDIDMDVDIELTTLEKPDTKKIENAFGKELASVLHHIKKINLLKTFDEYNINENVKDKSYDIIINTHGDIDPFYNDDLSKKNTITYCHYPTAKSLIEKGDKDYLEKYLKITRAYSFFYSSSSSSSSSSSTLSHQQPSSSYAIQENSDKDSEDHYDLKNFNAVLKIINFYKQQYLKWLKYAYTNMIKNTTLVTNSKYSSKAIFDECGIRDTMVLSPPVDVEKFRKFVFLPYSSSRDEKVEEGDDYRDKSKHEDIDNCDKKIEKENIILVISRIDPTKKIEKAITLAHLLKNKGIGKGMVIVGNLDEYNHGYYISLKEMVEDLKLKDYVKFEIDAPFDKLLLNMKKSKVYFHPRSGEHFGMSIVEAMSAGLIPVVPDEGGQTEFVPSQYQYNTLEQASQIVSNALDIPIRERLAISNSVQRFSVSKFKKNFQQIVKDKLLIAEKMH